MASDAMRRIAAVLSSALLTTACGQKLVVTDLMDPTIEQVLSTPSAI